MIEALGEKIKDYMDLISKDSQIQGVLRYKKYLRVEGRIDGDLIALEPGEGSVLFIGPNGIVNGNIYGCEVIVEGTVRGEIQATRKEGQGFFLKSRSNHRLPWQW